MPDMHIFALPRLFERKQRLGAWTRSLVHGAIFVLAIVTALLSYRYLFDIGPVPPVIAVNRFRTVWLVAHAGFASTALLTGVVQFSSRLRQRLPSLHRRLGRVYASSCLIGAVTGFVLALGSSAGPVTSVGFASLAIAWFYATSLGWQRARERRFASHRRWMIRSWALTLAAVALRIYLPLSEAAGLLEVTAYRAISFLCWMPNLLVAEFLLRRKEGRVRPRSTPLAQVA